MGWRVEGEIPDLPKMVIIVAPHSSNWDFVIGVAAKLAMRLRVKYLGKDSLFRFPLGILMRRLGGIPVDRSNSNDVVTSIVDQFQRRRQLVLAIAPEGTRRRVERWRSGFYHIARGAGVPIVPVTLDWSRRVIAIAAPVAASGDPDDDLARLKKHYEGVPRREAVR